MAALGVAKEPGIVSPSYAVYRPLDPMDFVPGFLDYLLRISPYRSEYTCLSTGIRPSRLRLYPDKFLQIPLMHPSRKEQEEILSVIQSETGKFDSAIAQVEKLIGLVLEYRAQVVSCVTTGKLDARDARIPAKAGKENPVVEAEFAESSIEGSTGEEGQDAD